MFSSSHWPDPLYRRGETAVVEDVEHPNFRLICAFILGGLCAAALYLVFTSVYIRDLCQGVRRGLYWLVKRMRRTRSNDPEDPHAIAFQEKTTYRVKSNDDTTRHNCSALVFTLNLCFVFAALAQFATLLSFRDNKAWDMGCAFVVAWGGMMSHVTGFVCSCILCLEFRRKGAQHWELVGVWVGILVALALVFVDNALSPGTTRFVKPFATYICRMGHNLGVSLAASLVQFVVNNYLAVRLIAAQLPTAPCIRDILLTIGKPSSGKATSVVIFNMLTLAPNTLALNLIAQYVPFSCGGLLVLVAFNFVPSNAHVSSTQLSSSSPNFSVNRFPEHELPTGATDTVCPSTGIIESLNLTSGANNTALRVSVTSDQSFDSGIIGSVEKVVLATAVRHLATRSPLSPASPQSSSPRVEVFAPRSSGSRTNHILPSQVEFAEQLEREIADRAPIIGPVVRPIDHNRNLRILVRDEDTGNCNKADVLRTPASILGSDIIYWSPTASTASPQKVDGVVPFTERTSAFGMFAIEVPQEDSYVANQEVLSDYYFDRRSFSVVSELTIESIKSSKRSVKHFSVTSHRKGSVDELSIIPEQGFRPAQSTPSPNDVRRSRRTTFGGQAVSLSYRKTSTVHTPRGIPPMPTRSPPYLSTLPQSSVESPSPVTPLETHMSKLPGLRPPLPALPDSALQTRVLSLPKSSVRAVQHSGLSPGAKYPRPLPTAPIPNNVGRSADEPHDLLTP